VVLVKGLSCVVEEDKNYPGEEEKPLASPLLSSPWEKGGGSWPGSCSLPPCLLMLKRRSSSDVRIHRHKELAPRRDFLSVSLPRRDCMGEIESKCSKGDGEKIMITLVGGRKEKGGGEGWPFSPPSQSDALSLQEEH